MKENTNTRVMRWANNIIAYCVLPVALLLMSGCFKEDLIDAPSGKGIGQTAMIEMGPDYDDQYFYSLETNQVLSHNSRFVYDLMFDCDPAKFRIWLNTAKFMSVVRTGKTELSAISAADTVGKNWHYELGEFTPDSNAIGEWWTMPGDQPASRGEVYIIHRGVDMLENQLGFIKMQVNNFTGTSYSITYSQLDGTGEHTILVQKDPTRNYKYLSFNTHNVLDNIEPEKAKWDLCFTRFTYIFYEPEYLPYQVTGVLQNPSRVQAYVDSTVIFDSMTISNLDFARLSTKRDAIGYIWKDYVLGAYTAKPYYVYFIKADEDKFYKLHFLDFNKNGVKGYPTFEYYKL